MDKNYTIGLDIGTNSVGWAVMNEDFTLAQGKKKITEIAADGTKKYRKSRTNLWGVRLFDEGQVAANRRLQRGGRRRIARRKKRLEYLREIFEPEILKFDDSFFIRMDESFIQNDDKDFINPKTSEGRFVTKYPLFNGQKGSGESYAKDADYLQHYPTIYHLRKRLMEDESQADIRLVYLALHHIVKFRGHFIDEERELDFNNINIKQSLSEFISAWNNYFEEKKENFQVSADKNVEIERILKAAVSPSRKVERILGKAKNEEEKFNILDFQAPKEFEQLLKYIVGNQGNLKSIFDLEFDLKISVNDEPEKFEENLQKLEMDEQRDIIELAQKVNNDMQLSSGLLNGSISAKKVSDFELHKQQLKDLRAYLKDFPELYKKIFGLSMEFKTKYVRDIKEKLLETGQEGIYTKYTKGTWSSSKKNQFSTYQTKIDDFYKDFKDAFKKEKVDLPEWISDAMEKNEFLPKQRLYTNGSYPFQVHLNELEEILKNQGQYYDFLKFDKNDEVTEDTEKTKIALLMRFRIPYFVGTLSKNPAWREESGELRQDKSVRSQNAWAVRKPNAPVFKPWNFDEVFDLDKSSMNFIKRMTNYDTYLPDEKVLPAKSILLQKFNVLNRLTKVKIKDCWLSPENRTKIFDELFAGKNKTGKVSKKNLADFVNCHKQDFPQVIEDIKVEHISGIDGRGFLEQFTTIHDLSSVGFSYRELNNLDNQQDFEKIVEWLTIFDDRKIFTKRFNEKFNQKYPNVDKKKLSELTKRYKGWGRYSRKLLLGTGDCHHNIMWYLLNDEGNREFMQLINDKDLPFKSALEKKLGGRSSKNLSYKDLVAPLATSPANKRGIWQALQIVDEIIEYKGYKPATIAIEFARENQTTVQGTKDERKRNIEKQLAKISELAEDIKKIYKDKKLTKFENRDFTEKLQLYFLQNAKDMYTGNSLTLLDNGNIVDKDGNPTEVDHIIPQSLLKNDSLENKVLTCHDMNNRKGDNGAASVATGQAKALWKMLEKEGVLSQTKLSRLRKSDFSEEDIKGFLNRQLVETRQIMKHVAAILKNHFTDEDGKATVEVLSVKSMYADALKKQLGIIKVLKRTENGRITLNDYHHAHDAYLNAVVALFRKKMAYDTAYTRILAKIHEEYGDDRRKSKERATALKKQAFQQANDMDTKVYHWQNRADGSREKIWTGEYRSIIDKGEVWWSKEITDKIFDTIDAQKTSQFPIVTYKTEKQRGSYSLAGNLKAGNGGLQRKNYLPVSLYGGNNADSTNVAVLKADKTVEEVNLVKFDKKKLEVGTQVLDKFQLLKNDNLELELGKAELVALEKYFTKPDKLTKGAEKALTKIAKYEKIEPEIFIELLGEITDKKEKIDEIIQLSRKTIWRYLTAPAESQKAQQFSLSQNEMNQLRVFLTNRENSVDIDFGIIRKMLEFAINSGASGEINLEKFKKEFDQLPKEDVIMREGNTVKSATMGQKQVVQDLIALISRGTSRGLSHFSNKYSGKVKWENPMNMEDIGLKPDPRYNAAKDVVNPNTTLINQSITGLYETRRKLN